MSDITQQMDKLEIPIKLSFPVINVSTFELGRAESVFSEIAKKVGKHFIVMPFKKLPDPGTMKAMADEAKKASKNGLVVFDVSAVKSTYFPSLYCTTFFAMGSSGTFQGSRASSFSRLSASPICAST